MRRILGDVVAGVHAVFELAVIAAAVVGWWLPAAVPLGWLTVTLLLVGLPMAARRGHCWLTELEQLIRGHRVPSMTFRLCKWLTFGRWVPGATGEWAVMAIPVLFWLARMGREAWPW